MLVEVEYWIATYHGRVRLNASEDEEDATLVARAKAKLRRESPTSLPMYYERYAVHRTVEDA